MVRLVHNSLLSLSLLGEISLKSIIILFVISETISFSILITGFLYQYNISNIIASGIIVFLAIVYASRDPDSLLRSGENNRIHFLFLLCLVCWFIAETLFGLVGGYLKIDYYPSFADIFYITGNIFLIIFLVLMNRTFKIELEFIVSSIVTFSLVLLYVLYISIFIFEIYTFDGNPLDLILLYTYPIMDIFIMIGSFVYFYRGRSISLDNEYYYLIFISLSGFFFFIADLSFVYNDLFGIADIDLLFDLLYGAGYCMIGIAIIIRLNYSIKKMKDISE